MTLEISIDIPRTSETAKGHMIRTRRAIAADGALPWPRKVASLEEVTIALAQAARLDQHGQTTLQPRTTRVLRLVLQIEYQGRRPKPHAILGYLSSALSQPDIRVTA